MKQEHPLPDYWLPRPQFNLSHGVLNQLEDIYASQVAPATGNWIDVPLPVPKWIFLCWLSDEKNLLLHGSGDPNIGLFEPRTPIDNSPDDFSKQTAVFAASDGISPMFYAMIDRGRIHVHMMTGALYFRLNDGGLSRMHYFFSVNDIALEQHPWRQGIIYILPRDGFVQQEPYDLGQYPVFEPHWACLNPVRPLAKIGITTADFPFFAQIRAHDERYIREKARTDPYGYPWLEIES